MASWNRLDNAHIDCRKMDLVLSLQVFAVSLFSWFGLVSHHVVIFVPLPQIRPTWTGTPPCVYFLLARATTWRGVCDGEEVLTGNRYIALKYIALIPLITFIVRDYYNLTLNCYYNYH